MKAFTFIAVGLLLVGCSGVDGYDIREMRTVPYECGGGSSQPPSSNGNGPDAAVCLVQGNAALTGSFAGSALVAKDAIEVFDTTKDTYTLEITDYADACSLGNDVHAGSSVVSITYRNQELSSGIYDVTKSADLHVTHVKYDATCKPTTTEATSGSITFGKLDLCGSKGSFDLVFGADHVTASFTASLCSVASEITPTCR